MADIESVGSNAPSSSEDDENPGPNAANPGPIPANPDPIHPQPIVVHQMVDAMNPIANISLYHTRFLPPLALPPLLIPVYEMAIGGHGRLIGQVGRSQVRVQGKFKYTLCCIAHERQMVGQYRISLAVWEQRNGLQMSTIVLRRLFLSDLPPLSEVYLIRQENALVHQRRNMWYEDHHERAAGDFLEFSSENEIPVSVFNPVAGHEEVGFVFKQLIDSGATLLEHLLICGKRASVARGIYRLIYVGGVGVVQYPLEEANFQGFLLQLRGIRLHLLRQGAAIAFE